MLVAFSSQHSTTECILLQYLQCVEGCVSRRSFDTDGQCEDDCVSQSNFNPALLVVIYLQSDNGCKPNCFNLDSCDISRNCDVDCVSIIYVYVIYYVILTISSVKQFTLQNYTTIFLFYMGYIMYIYV